MKVTDKLYLETFARVGPDQMVGINRLITEGHFGIAEKHTVGKLIEYVRSLESRLGIKIPDTSKINWNDHIIKVTENGVPHYLPRSA